ncbi:MAG: tRNA pseudouridine(55) synthase TruB [Alistipes sp.]|jgi:tRNA pseudouridine55 synthase|nr:tRNA pseudouridine(55) synthase TruB [Alistipes sp.]
MEQKEFSRDLNFPEGYVLCVDKPLEWTSTDVVRKIKYALERLGHKRIKVGHAGTLDPLATGVLLVCIGKATKRVDELQSERKEYVAEVTLGATTVSGDLEHPVQPGLPWRHITRADVELTLKNLTGERLQTPPVYSAKKMEGERAYELARRGEEPEMRKALINIYEMELLECRLPGEMPNRDAPETLHDQAEDELPRIKIRVVCSKGTYIRSLAMEIGKGLASGGYLSSLRRTRSGGYNVADALEIKKIVEILDPVKHF